AKLLKDSQNLRDLRDRLLASPKPPTSRGASPRPHSSATAEPASRSSADLRNTYKTGESLVDEKLRQIYHDPSLGNWTTSSKKDFVPGDEASRVAAENASTDAEVAAVSHQMSGLSCDDPILKRPS
ncbi:hypothetical protein FHG87_006193, partial [Trinorchestia longiramus]